MWLNTESQTAFYYGNELDSAGDGYDCSATLLTSDGSKVDVK